jgi:hypothetical protein
MSGRRRFSFVAARIAIAGFCWLTALYASVAASPFAYQQFIRPRVFNWVGTFSAWHATVAWLWLALLMGGLGRDLRASPPRRAAALALAAGAAGLVIWNATHSVVATLADGDRSLVVAVSWLAPLVALGALDHTRGAALLRARATEDPALLDGRMFIAALVSAVYVATVYAVLASIGLWNAFEPDLMTGGLAIGFGRALVDLLLIFLSAFLVVALVSRAAVRSLAAQYVALWGMLVALFASAFTVLVGAAVGLHGPASKAAAVAAGLSIVSVWTGLRLERWDGAGPRWAVEVFLGAPRAGVSTAVRLLPFAAVAVLAWALAAAANLYDWDFVVSKAGVLVVCLTMFVVAYRAASGDARIGERTIAIVCAAPVVAHVAWGVGPEQQHVLERYRVYNAAFRLADDLVRAAPGSPAFERYLKANSGFTDVDVAPIDIDFVPHLAPVPADRTPLIFLFVIDSLRPDYLEPYNPAIRFTPRIARFANESVVLRNAFTPYGGTGLSMPAIWAGSLLLHKQYVTPFARMNALDKLLQINGYRRLMSLDHITAELFGPDEGVEELDRGRPEMELDFCTTLGEIESKLDGYRPGGAPIFAQTRSLTLHMSKIRNGSVGEGESYPGLQAPYASRVRRIDSCFGAFVDRLKRRNLYDRSLIVLTSDHGEMLGEDGRWGHSYYLTPEVVQVPLIVHLPAWMRSSAIDPAAIVFSTDITPTVYASLGYDPRAVNRFMGSSIAGSGQEVWRGRRREAQVFAASYGAVYAVARRNGRRLYITDAINGRDTVYERGADGRWTEKPVTAGIRMADQIEIRRHVDELARLYRVTPHF